MGERKPSWRSALPLMAVGTLLVMAGTSPNSRAQPVDFQNLPALEIADAVNAVLLDTSRAGSRIVAVGERGLILYTDDNGISWQQAQVPLSATLTAVTFATEQQGWAAGHSGVILHSQDGGASWQQQFDGNRANQQWLDYTRARQAALRAQLDALQQASTADEDAIADLEARVEDASFAAEDAETALANGPADPFLDIWFADIRNGLAVGAYGMIYRTDNGGRSWTLAASGIDNPDRYHYYAIATDNDGRLFLSGEAGLMYLSLDGGAHWQRLGPFYDGSLFGVLTTVDAVLSFGLRGHIFRSTDGGENWQALESAPFSLYGGRRLSDDDIVLVGAGGGLAYSRDGGRSFTTDNHRSRSSFAALTDDGRGGLVVVGMKGVVDMKDVVDMKGAPQNPPEHEQ